MAHGVLFVANLTGRKIKVLIYQAHRRAKESTVPVGIKQIKGIRVGASDRPEDHHQLFRVIDPKTRKEFARKELRFRVILGWHAAVEVDNFDGSIRIRQVDPDDINRSGLEDLGEVSIDDLPDAPEEPNAEQP